MSRKYYTYVYYDPENMTPFYVGKGIGSRYKQHINQATNWHPKNSKNQDKLYKIKEILDKGVAPIILKYFESFDEDKVFDYEVALIKLFGRLDKNTGTLTNHSDGGRINFDVLRGDKHPLYGKHRTDEEKLKISENHADFSGSNSPSARHIMIKSPNGIIYESFGDFQGFCKQHKLAYSSMNLKLCTGRILDGSTKNWEVWYKEEFIPKSVLNGFRHDGNDNRFGRKMSQESIDRGLSSRMVYYEITYLENISEVIGNLTNFCRKNNLSYYSMYKVAIGRQKSHKGYKCKRLTNEETIKYKSQL